MLWHPMGSREKLQQKSVKKIWRTTSKKRTRGDTIGRPKLKDVEATNVRSIGKRLVGVAWKLGGPIQFGEVRKQFVEQ
jgi:hypothetical protein